MIQDPSADRRSRLMLAAAHLPLAALLLLDLSPLGARLGAAPALALIALALPVLLLALRASRPATAIRHEA
jgi:hypothetical protein